VCGGGGVRSYLYVPSVQRCVRGTAIGTAVEMSLGGSTVKTSKKT
jgi:hypothetical protein